MDPISLHDYAALARERLPEMVHGYYSSGADDEITLRENREAWRRVRLRPRVLAGVNERDLSTTVLGQAVRMPVLTSPTAFNAMAHPDGELAVARAATAAGIIAVVSTLSNYSMEEIAQASSTGTRWFQLYCFRDRAITRMLVERAKAAGYTALCLTVDAPVFGRRERDIRNRFHLPPGLSMKNLESAGLDQLNASGDESALQRYIADQLDAGLTWELLDWLRGITTLPILVKGILSAEDANLAEEHGANGIIVSNHGGRQLDGALSACEALPGVVQAVDGRIEVLVDGGIRRGSDVLKALAMGAGAVLIGRPYLWGLAVNGEAGVSHVLQLLRTELDTSMALAGCPTVSSINRSLIV